MELIARLSHDSALRPPGWRREGTDCSPLARLGSAPSRLEKKRSGLLASRTTWLCALPAGEEKERIARLSHDLALRPPGWRREGADCSPLARLGCEALPAGEEKERIARLSHDLAVKPSRLEKRRELTGSPSHTI